MRGHTLTDTYNVRFPPSPGKPSWLGPVIILRDRDANGLISTSLETVGESMPVQELNGAVFDKFSQEQPAAVVDVWAPWCGPCRMVSPIVERLSDKYRGKVAFGKLNSDDNGEKAGALGIMSIPTLLFYKEGKLVDRIVGAYPEEVIDEHIQKLL